MTLMKQQLKNMYQLLHGEDIMSIIIGLLIATIDLWVWFAITTRVADGAKSRKQLNKFQLVFIYFFAAKDVFYNYTWGSLLFLEFASNDRKTLTARLKHILNTEFENPTWRFHLAVFLCKYMIEPIDFGHCNLKLYI